MTRRRLLDYLKSLAHVERYRILKPLHHRAGERALWAFNRKSVARGVAVGFFFGILTPVAQIVFALIFAILLRANIVVAAASTMITNPFILPFVYVFAYRIGTLVTGRGAALTEVDASEDAAENALEVTDWIPTLMEWVSSTGYPLLIGVVCLAALVASSGYVIAYAAWGLFASLFGHKEEH